MNKMLVVKRIGLAASAPSRGLIGIVPNARQFSAPAKDWRDLPRFSIEDFLANKDNFQVDDKVVSSYISKAAKHSLIKFQSETEETQFKDDFKSALVFVRKLQEVDTAGEDPLETVLDFYGGNSQKMREEGLISDELF